MALQLLRCVTYWIVVQAQKGSGKGAGRSKGRGDKALSSAVRVGEKQWWHEESGAAHGPDDNDAYYLAEVCQARLLSLPGGLACIDMMARSTRMCLIAS